MIYAKSNNPDEFRMHKVTQRYVHHVPKELPPRFEEISHHGIGYLYSERINSCQMETR